LAHLPSIHSKNRIKVKLKPISKASSALFVEPELTLCSFPKQAISRGAGGRRSPARHGALGHIQQRLEKQPCCAKARCCSIAAGSLKAGGAFAYAKAFKLLTEK
jgi:hypothetical protein